MLTKEVFTGTDGIITVTVNEKSWNDDLGEFELTPIPFIDRGTALMRLEFDDQTVMSGGDEITFDNDGHVNFKLGLIDDAPVKSRAISAVLNVIDTDNPNGLDVIHPSREDSSLSLIFK